MTLSPNSRFSIVEVPARHPGTCCVCGSTNDSEREFVDFGAMVRNFGAIYMCTVCLRDAAQSIDYVPFLEAEAQIEKREALHRQLEIVEEQLMNFKESVKRAFVDCTCGALNLSNSVSRVGIAETAGPDSDANKFGGVEGSGDVLALAEFDPAAIADDD